MAYIQGQIWTPTDGQSKIKWWRPYQHWSTFTCWLHTSKPRRKEQDGWLVNVNHHALFYLVDGRCSLMLVNAHQRDVVDMSTSRKPQSGWHDQENLSLVDGGRRQRWTSTMVDVRLTFSSYPKSQTMSSQRVNIFVAWKHDMRNKQWKHKNCSINVRRVFVRLTIYVTD